MCIKYWLSILLYKIHEQTKKFILYCILNAILIWFIVHSSWILCWSYRNTQSKSDEIRTNHQFFASSMASTEHKNKVVMYSCTRLNRYWNTERVLLTCFSSQSRRSLSDLVQTRAYPCHRHFISVHTVVSH